MDNNLCLLLCNPQEDANRGKPNWEHLSDDLHVLITVEDSENRARMKLARAVEEVQKLLVPVSIEIYGTGNQSQLPLMRPNLTHD